MNKQTIEEQLEQERVRLAGCLCIAEGHIDETVKQGVYGWSLPYERIKELRQENAKLKEELKDNKHFTDDMIEVGADWEKKHAELRELLSEERLLKTILKHLQGKVTSGKCYLGTFWQDIAKAIAKGKE